MTALPEGWVQRLTKLQRLCEDPGKSAFVAYMESYGPGGKLLLAQDLGTMLAAPDVPMLGGGSGTSVVVPAPESAVPPAVAPSAADLEQFFLMIEGVGEDYSCREIWDFAVSRSEPSAVFPALYNLALDLRHAWNILPVDNARSAEARRIIDATCHSLREICVPEVAGRRDRRLGDDGSETLHQAIPARDAAPDREPAGGAE